MDPVYSLSIDTIFDYNKLNSWQKSADVVTPDSLYSITSNAPAWVTLYTSNAAAVSDYTRTISTDPTPGSGVIAESIQYASGTTNFTPAVVGFNNEASPTTAIPMKVYNTGNTSNVISVTLTLLKLEG